MLYSTCKSVVNLPCKLLAILYSHRSVQNIWPNIEHSQLQISKRYFQTISNWRLFGTLRDDEIFMRHYYESKFLYILVLEHSRIFKNNYQIFINMTIGDKLINKDENINKKIISSTMVFKNLFKQTQTRISKLKCANKLQH